MMNRRTFLHWTLGATLATALPFGCRRRKTIGGRIIGASAQTGHILRTGVSGQPDVVRSCEVAIVGAGISGLSAAYFLNKAGVNDLLVLDLEKEAGGNARFGSNSVSAFPWGAHYVPIPNNDLTDYIEFLADAGVITGNNEAGLPVYNEEYLCFDPEERLYLNGKWQEGLVPHFGVPEMEKVQIRRFLDLMDSYRQERGADHKYAFAIPVNASSKDQRWTSLDRLTLENWLRENGFTSNYLHQYVNYCCRDDYGTDHSDISAWMGIHYFAGRKGRGANAGGNDVLTWPQGNGFLASHLLQPIREKVDLGCLVTSLRSDGKNVQITYFDTKDKKVKAISAGKCILAIPQFIAGRILGDPQRMQTVKQHLQYSPWMVANFTVSKLEERSGAPASWDNVLHGGQSLGYVEASHQLLRQDASRRNFTYYLPLTGKSAVDERKRAQEKTHADWVQVVMEDLKRVHPNIEDAVDEMNIMVWGHAMAKPLPGLIHGPLREQLSRPINGKIYFAHTDLAGDSIFEEAFYQGLGAARACMDS